jgi:major membrane immunogen (membrane-anchored lipoprotein)
MPGVRSRPLHLLVLLAVALPGCGGSTSGFAEKANATCRDGRAKVEKVKDDPEKSLDALDATIAELKHLDAPADKRATYPKMIAANEKFARDVRAALAASDTKALAATDDDAGDAQARALGLDDCVG